MTDCALLRLETEHLPVVEVKMSLCQSIDAIFFNSIDFQECKHQCKMWLHLARRLQLFQCGEVQLSPLVDNLCEEWFPVHIGNFWIILEIIHLACHEDKRLDQFLETTTINLD